MNILNVKEGWDKEIPYLLFFVYLIADVLNKILKKAQNLGHLVGISLGNNLDNILNLHLADDTLLFLQANAANIEVLKWIFIGFEHLSGMKVNFS